MGGLALGYRWATPHSIDCSATAKTSVFRAGASRGVGPQAPDPSGFPRKVLRLLGAVLTMRALMRGGAVWQLVAHKPNWVVGSKWNHLR